MFIIDLCNDIVGPSIMSLLIEMIRKVFFLSFAISYVFYMLLNVCIRQSNVEILFHNLNGHQPLADLLG